MHKNRGYWYIPISSVYKSAVIPLKYLFSYIDGTPDLNSVLRGIDIRLAFLDGGNETGFTNGYHVDIAGRPYPANLEEQ